MRGPQPIPIYLSDRQQQILEKIAKRHQTPQQLGKRARMILLMAQGKNNQQAANLVEVHQETAARWRGRWLEELGTLTAVEMNAMDEKELERLMIELLGDRERSGAPVKFTAEQVTQIVALACEDPVESNRPINSWTNRELATEAQLRGIVESISHKSVGRFLKRSRTKAAQN